MKESTPRSHRWLIWFYKKINGSPFSGQEVISTISWGFCVAGGGITAMKIVTLMWHASFFSSCFRSILFLRLFYFTFCEFLEIQFFFQSERNCRLWFLQDCGTGIQQTDPCSGRGEGGGTVAVEHSKKVQIKKKKTYFSVSCTFSVSIFPVGILELLPLDRGFSYSIYIYIYLTLLYGPAGEKK